MLLILLIEFLVLVLGAGSRSIAVSLACGLALGTCQRTEGDGTNSAASGRPMVVAGVQRVNVVVTANGFVPERIHVRVGVPVALSVTRTVEQTCAKDIVIEQYAILAPLPFNETVQVRFRPTEPGRIRFAACAMNMVAGEIVVD